MNDKIVLELSINEAKIIAACLRSNTPATADEIVVIMLYARIQRKIEEKMT